MQQISSPVILIVEDSEHDALLLEVELRRFMPGAVFARVETERQLQGALSHVDWDLVICDHSMPGLDSDRAMRLVREACADIPLVIYSGSLGESAAILAMRAGAQDFVDKAAPARLVAVVERELRNAQLRRAKRRADLSIIELSHYDALTRLPNRQSLDEVMNIRLQAAQAVGAAPALLVLDLDRFMRFNSSLGYVAGDILMQQVAKRLKSTVGADGYVARLGEDSFAVLMEHGGESTANEVGMRLQRAFSEPLRLERDELYVAFSMGIARFPDDGIDVATLRKNAEEAMFFAKRQGGNRIQSYSRYINHDAAYRMKLENSLRGALLREELELHYQPIVDLQSGSVVAMEALARWRHAELGNVPPDQFIPIAEETGAIVEIGEWVMRTACRQTRAWREAGYPNLKVAVNISAVQFASESLCDSIAAILRESGMPPAALELEITEGVAMKDAASSVSILKSIRNLGVKIAIDDFGTGFSALSYLRRFPIDIIKIDKMFVRAMLGQKEDAAIVRAIIGLGEQLGLTLHAEGVESVEQNDLLMTLGCHRAQGFEIARPMAASDVPAFLAARKGESAAAKVRVCRC